MTRQLVRFGLGSGALGSGLVGLAALLGLAACGGSDSEDPAGTGSYQGNVPGAQPEMPAGAPTDTAEPPAPEDPAPTTPSANEQPDPNLPIDNAPPAEQPGTAPTQPDTPVATPPVVSGTPVEDSGADCAVPQLPGFNQLQPLGTLPDPFVALDGSRITTRDQWRCRRAEISAEVQEFELGPKPAKPSIVTGAIGDDNQLTITVGEPNDTVQFSVGITPPTNAGSGPFPALIEIGGSSLDNSVFDDLGVARINFNNGAMGSQNGNNTRGQGTFYDLYGADHPAGSMMAWAWGVSRIIDALETTEAANIDTAHLAVTGCSRNGKGALVVGAFDERIALTIPQESGAGGSASWRISESQTNAILAQNPAATVNDRVQRLREAQGEQPWFRANFGQFNTAVDRVPYDHHEVLGMVAPRGLFVIDNSSMNWLGNDSSYTDSVAGRQIFAALGVETNMGVSQVGDHNHCAFPASQRAELVAFVSKFLRDDATANTDVNHTDGLGIPFQLDRARWFPWETPTLE